MLNKRIIPCLDIKNGRTVKGVNFTNLRDAGSPPELAARYQQEGADELLFLDITATEEKKQTAGELIQKIAKKIDIPFTVGGGIKSIKDAEAIIKAGANRVSINSSAVMRPELICEIAKEFGSNSLTVAIDTKRGSNGEWMVYINGGKSITELSAVDWSKRAEDLGAGEILLTSMNNDGRLKGFAIDITQLISEKVKIPVIASGGAGTMEHFAEVFKQTKATAALGASVFHFGMIAIPELKQYLREQNIAI